MDNTITVTINFRSANHDISVWHVDWDSEITGAIQSDFLFPYQDNDLNLVLRALSEAVSPTMSFTAEELHRLRDLEIQDPYVLATDIVKRKIHRSFDTSSLVVLQIIYNYVAIHEYDLSFILRFPKQSCQLLQLPWELFFCDTKDLFPQNAHTLISVERQVLQDTAIFARKTNISLGNKIRLLSITPSQYINRSVMEEELTARSSSWDSFVHLGLGEKRSISSATFSSISEAIYDFGKGPNIVHYVGHGKYYEGKNYVMLDREDGRPDRVEIERLSAILGRPQLFVFLTASLNFTGINTFAEYIVVPRITTRIITSIEFTRIFYRELLINHRSIQSSIAIALRTLHFNNNSSPDWYTMNLYSSYPNTNQAYIPSKQGLNSVHISAPSIKSGINTTLPNDHHHQGEELADLLSDLIRGITSPESVRQQIVEQFTLTETLRLLAGKQIETSKHLLSFGSDSQLGDISINDIAGGNIIHLTVNLSQ